MSNIQLNSIENLDNNNNNNNFNKNNLKITENKNNKNNYLSDNFVKVTCLSTTSTSTIFSTTNTLFTSSIITTTTTTTSTSTSTTIINSSFNNNNNDKIQTKEIINCSNSKNLLKAETREIDTITDICCSDNIPEVDLFSLINDNLPLYKLRADTLFTHNNSDWIQAPLYIDEEQIGELTTEQIKHTLDYFIFNEFFFKKEKDLELAATIGKHLLDKGQVLESKIEILEEQLDKATEMVNQLRHDIALKDDLLQNFIEFEDGLNQNSLHNRINNDLNVLNDNDGNNVEMLRKRISKLENENYLLKNDADNLKEETNDFEKKEQLLVETCVKELMSASSKLETIEEELKVKTKECSQQQDEISNLYHQIIELQMKIKSLTVENAELQSLINISASTQNELANELVEIKSKYNECISMLHTTQEDLRVLRRKYTKKTEIRSLKQQQRQCLYAPWMTANSFAAELHFSSQNQEQVIHDYKQKRDSFDLVRKVREKLIKTMPGSNADSCFPSDSEYESMITSTSSLNITSNTTMVNLNNNALLVETNNLANRCDSHLSNYSGSYLSSNIGTNIRSYLPDKLQIVKPIEGSQTLQHWQQLATPNLGCLIEPRPGIYIKGKDPNVDSNSSTCSSVSTNDIDHNIDIATIRDINKKTYDEITSDLDETFNISYIEEDDINDNNYQILKNPDTISTYTYVNSNKLNKNETNSVFSTLPSIMSLETLNDINNINLNERLLLKKLLISQEENRTNIETNTVTTNTTSTITSSINTNTTTTAATTTVTSCANPYLDEIKNLSQKYYQTPLASDNLKITTNKYKIKSLGLHDKLHDLNLLGSLQNEINNNNQQTVESLPDTPPPSPTNELLMIDDNDNEIEIINNNNNTEINCKYISTPPTSPIIIQIDSNENNKNKIKLLESNFVNEIIERLSIFSFKSIESNNNNNSNNATTPTASSTQKFSFLPSTLTNNQQFSKIVKPLALYANNNETLITPLPTPTTPIVTNSIFTTKFSTVEEEPINKQHVPNIEQNNNTEQSITVRKKIGVPDTPPPSPKLRLSPTPSIPVNDEILMNIDEKKFQNSAFMKLSTMNPLINKSIDLSKLLGSLTNLKRNQHLS